MGIESILGSDCENRIRICMITITTSTKTADTRIPCQVEKSLVHNKNPIAPTLSIHDQIIITYPYVKPKKETSF